MAIRKKDRKKESIGKPAPRSAKEEKPEREEGKTPEAELRSTAGEYDRAIREYEEYYRQQSGAAYSYAPYGYSGYAEQYGYPSAQVAEPASGGLEDYACQLNILEKALADFEVFQGSLSSVEEGKRREYLAQWKKYLEELLEFSRSLTKSLEESMESLAKETD